jgi:hypothetical protein
MGWHRLTICLIAFFLGDRLRRRLRASATSQRPPVHGDVA